MKRWLILLAGLASYVLFLVTFLYLFGFLGGVLVPTQLDGPSSEPLGRALLIDVLLVLLFGLQHSIMARPGFKAFLTRWIPQPLERSAYVLATNAVLGLLFWQWRPLGLVVWQLDQPLARAATWSVFMAGGAIVLVTTFLINHFDLFGLRQVWLYFRGRPYTQLPFVTPGPYRLVRHPLYIGWLLTFWAAPTMTVAHLLFALGMTAYILVAIAYEERDLVQAHTAYAEYRRRVGMLVPKIPRRATRRSLPGPALSAGGERVYQ